MKLEVGMYVRTKDGKIAKFIKYDEEDKEELVTDYYEYSTIWIKDVIEASHNIIDLIEVGDYVNGLKINEIVNGIKKCLKTEYRLNLNYVYFCFYENDIESIVTKEMFSNVEYRVETS